MDKKIKLKDLWQANLPLALLSVLLVFFSEFLINLFQLIKGRLIDSALYKTEELAFNFLWFFIIVIAIPFSFYLYSRAFNRFRALSLGLMRKTIFSSILARSYPAYLEKKEGVYLNVYTNTINDIDNFYFSSLFGFLQILGVLFSALIMLFLIHPLLVLVCLIALVPAIYLPKFFEEKIKTVENAAIKARETNLEDLTEYLDGLETIINFERKLPFMSKFKHSTQDIADKRMQYYHYMTLSMQLTRLILNIYTVISILIVAWLVEAGSLSVGRYVQALGIMLNIMANVPYTTIYLQRFKVAQEHLNYLNEILYFEEDTTERSQEIVEVNSISFNEISFTYPAAKSPVIKDFNWEITKPGISLITGPSGSGKSALAALLFSYYPLDEGEIKINGINIQDVANLNELITIMRQDPAFFDGSLKDNLTMFQEIDEEYLQDLMKALGLDKFATKEKLDGPVGKYSGGEARRMMVLRALLRQSQITILDEPLANLDQDSIEKISQVLAKNSDSYLIIISHQDLDLPKAQVLNFTENS